MADLFDQERIDQEVSKMAGVYKTQEYVSFIYVVSLGDDPLQNSNVDL